MSPILNQEKLSDSEIAEICAHYLSLIEHGVMGLKKKSFYKIGNGSEKSIYGVLIGTCRKSLGHRPNKTEWKWRHEYAPEEISIRSHIKSMAKKLWGVDIHYVIETEGPSYIGTSIYVEEKLPYFCDFVYTQKKIEEAGQAA